MEENMKNKESKARFFVKITICFALLFVIFLSMDTSYISLATEENKEKEFCYLSDIPYVANQSSTAWKNIALNQTIDGALISVKVEGAAYTFEKGIWAHATSTVVYDLSEHPGYDYFTAYIGLNTTAASSSNGVKFYIYTSTDGTNWELKTDAEPAVAKPGQNATFVKVDIKNAKFLKLYANDNGGNGNDHAVYADPKLIKESYKEDNIVESVDEYDAKIKGYTNQNLSDERFELLLLQRDFVSKVGQYALKRFANESQANKEMLTWLMNDVENLRLYMLGGKPDGSYYNSLKVLADLYTNYKTDFDITETTKYGTVLGDLYKRMAITLSLTHSTRVALWMQPSSPENQSNAVTRYAIYKKMHADGKFVVSSRQDHTKWFEEYNIEEMRFVMNNIIDDEEILWLNEYTQKFIDEHPNQEEIYLQPHRYMKYIWPNYGKPEYHDEANKQMWSEKYGNFLDYGVTFRPGLYKLWMNLDNGAVCGGISKIGSNIRAVHGAPSAVIGQPGHAAIIYYRKDAAGKGYWSIDNDVSGWTLSEKGERMLIGWGNASYTRGSYQVVYMALAQEALNDYENFEKCEKMIMLANVYKDDLGKQEEIYRKALEIQPINIDVWYGLINVYNANESKNENDFYDLAKELSESLKCFPLPMYQLSNLIKPKLASIENSYRFTLLQTRILTQASVIPNNSEDKYYVYQPSITRAEANYLLGKLDKTIASFSFDGEDAGKIVLSNRFDGNGIRWDYSLDGKQTWNEVAFSADEEHKLQLTQEQINSITAENDIYIHIVGVNYEEENLYQIDIQESAGLPPTLYANDLENKLIAATPAMQWKLKEEDNWTFYSEKEPDLTGDKTVIVRMGATGVHLASTTSSTYNFTQDHLPDTRKYIPISHLSIQGVSTEATGQGRHAKNVIDGNINTNWHSAWNGSDREKYIIIKLDAPKSLTSLEYFPVDGGNGKIKNAVISVSMDGENWTEVVSSTNWAYDKTVKSVDFEPTQAQYIKLVGKETQAASSSLSFIAAAMFNLYEDTTKQPEEPEQPENPDKPEEPEQPENPDKPEEPEQPENPDKPEEPEQPENPDKPEEPEQPENPDKPEEPEQPENPDKPEEPEQPENPDKPEEPEQPENPDKPEEPEQPENPDKPEEPEQPENPENPDKPENPGGITSERYKIEEKYILRIAPNTTINEFKQNVQTEQEMIFTNKDGNEWKEDSALTTGMQLKVGSDLEFTLIVIGDINGDGQITITDFAKLKLHLIESEVLAGNELKAADMNGDGKVTMSDLAQLKLVLIGKMEIK